MSCCTIRYGKTCRQLKHIVENVAIKDNLWRSHVTDGWLTWFQQRHPRMSNQCDDAMAHIRMSAGIVSFNHDAQSLIKSSTAFSSTGGDVEYDDRDTSILTHELTPDEKELFAR